MRGTTQAMGKSTGGTAVGSGEHVLEAVRKYWNEHVHDLEVARHPVGSKEFFDELEAYRFEKLEYLPRVVDFTAYRGKHLLEVGCGVGIDLVRFAKHGAIVTGADLAETSIELAKKNFAHAGVEGELLVMNGEDLEFADDAFDVVYAHGVLQYTSGTQRMVDELYRVLKPGGAAILMVYNRYSWLALMAKLSATALEHEDAPVFKTFSTGEFRRMLGAFSQLRLVHERFPVRTRLHGGLKGVLYNALFVGGFNLMPRRLVRPFGWHIMAMAVK